MVILHIIIALVSVAFSTYAYVRPSTNKLHFSYGLVAATFVSGTYLALNRPAHIIETCIMGVVYLSLVGCIAMAARLKLARM